MFRKLFAFSVVSLFLATAAGAQQAVSPSGTPSHYTRGQLKRMMREAHAPEQYKALADYYAGLRQEYLREAEKDRRQWVERSRNVTWTGAKTPRPMDFSRDAYQCDISNAARAESAAAKYGQLAASKSPAPAS